MNLAKQANFSLTIINSPEMASMKLWTASEVMAMELASKPTAILKMPSKKLVAMKR